MARTSVCGQRGISWGICGISSWRAQTFSCPDYTHSQRGLGRAALCYFCNAPVMIESHKKQNSKERS
ncbi:DUF2614 family zinc ribbon-containing protein [Marinobacter sp. CA1]|uniref:DUF2614 family zinc ribbon-containing protein n=1 Tax=Marinobacter sp. CA1 TaxID=2817656 RepID=UPI001D08167A|nr:hypothetical protein J2887_18265 [Marinobacter sp. CA1]